MNRRRAGASTRSPGDRRRRRVQDVPGAAHLRSRRRWMGSRSCRCSSPRPCEEGLFTTRERRASWCRSSRAPVAVRATAPRLASRHRMPRSMFPAFLEAFAGAAGQMSFPLAGSVVSTGGATGTTEWSGTLTIHVVEGGCRARRPTSPARAPATTTRTRTRGSDRCHRSSLAWPELVAQKLGWRRASRSGRAAVPASTARADRRSRRGRRLARLSLAQIVPSPAPTGHLPWIGGIDLGYGSVVQYCLTHQPVLERAWERWVLPGRRIVNTGLRLVLRRLRAAAPDAQIVLVGYPNFMPYEGRAASRALAGSGGELMLHCEISANRRPGTYRPIARRRSLEAGAFRSIPARLLRADAATGCERFTGETSGASPRAQGRVLPSDREGAVRTVVFMPRSAR